MDVSELINSTKEGHDHFFVFFINSSNNREIEDFVDTHPCKLCDTSVART